MASEFVKIKCGDCENEQVVFRKPSTLVECSICGSKIAEPTGGKAELFGEVVDVVEARSDA